jgi:amino acid transporter
MSATTEDATSLGAVRATGLERGIDWTGAFWVASGVPPLVLFSIGAVAATVGKLSWIVWTVSIALGFIQSFTYAEIAGLFPNKSGGTSVYGAIAWVRYSKVIAPISVWCNWFAWSPVQATGSALAAGYILSGLFAPDSVVNTWQLPLLDLGFIKSGLSLRINGVFLLGAVILFSVKAIQDGGILRSANTRRFSASRR